MISLNQYLLPIPGCVLTYVIVKSALEFTTCTSPYSGIPLQVQLSLSNEGFVSITVLSIGVKNIINGIKNENNKLLIT